MKFRTRNFKVRIRFKFRIRRCKFRTRNFKVGSAMHCIGSATTLFMAAMGPPAQHLVVIKYVVALWDAFYIENKRFDLALGCPTGPPTPISKSRSQGEGASGGTGLRIRWGCPLGKPSGEGTA